MHGTRTRDTAAHASLHVMATADQRPNAAVRAEPRGIGTAGARDPLAREVKLLGRAPGRGHRGAGGRGAARPRGAHPPRGHRAATLGQRRTTDARWRPRWMPSTCLVPRCSSAPSGCTSSWPTWRRRSSGSAGSGRVPARPHGPPRRVGGGGRGHAPPGGRAAQPGARIAGAAVGRAGAHRASHRGATPDAAHRAPTLLSAARRAGRPATDADRGRRDPAPTARGDQPPVAHLAAAGPGAHAPGRGAQRDGVLRRVAVRGHAAAVPGARPVARPGPRARPGRGAATRA